MRNRAKCKLCGDLLESFHRHDYVQCKYKAIAIDGGTDYCRCFAVDWNNFIRIDDEDKEIIPEIIEKDAEEKKKEEGISEMEAPPLTREDHIKSIQSIIDRCESLPDHALSMPINHYDYLSLLYLLKAILSIEKPC